MLQEKKNRLETVSYAFLGLMDLDLVRYVETQRVLTISLPSHNQRFRG
jgi:hypothetical protein